MLGLMSGQAKPVCKGRVACAQPAARAARAVVRCSAQAETSGVVPQATPAVASRRTALAAGAALVAAAPWDVANAAEAAPPAWRDFSNDTLAYSFKYPTATASGDKLSLAFSRKPERYSSAAPLTADARQRIVMELIDLKDAYTVSVSVGPPAGVLLGKKPEEWTPKQIAETVLADKSTARVTSGQRVSLAKIERIMKASMDGTEYVIYEHVSQGTPTQQLGPGRETYRHAWSATAIRPGQDGTPYLYTFNIACPDALYTDKGIASFMPEAASSFRLLPTSRAYVAPDKDPWRFF